jgi:hypothetical protein
MHKILRSLVRNNRESDDANSDLKLEMVKMTKIKGLLLQKYRLHRNDTCFNQHS